VRHARARRSEELRKAKKSTLVPRSSARFPPSILIESILSPGCLSRHGNSRRYRNQQDNRSASATKLAVSLTHTDIVV
jgi:hypothetical protein